MGRKKRKRRKFLKRMWNEIKAALPRRHSISHMGYVRVNIKYPTKFVFNNMGKHQLTLAGHTVKMWSKRYQVFKLELRCVRCGISGKYFRLECNGSDFRKGRTWHFNLYALDNNGNEVLMTKDHIIPKSKGGSDSLRNLQTMCCRCNGEKGNELKPWNIGEGEFKNEKS